MRPWNPHGQTFHGEPITGVVPTGIRVHGPPLTPQQASYANAVFASFCSRIRLSNVNNPNAQGILADGTRYAINCVAGVCAITVFTGENYGAGQEDEAKLYVDSGWLIDNFPEEGWPTRATDGRYTVKCTSACATTWSGLVGIMEKYFVDTFKSSSAKAGASFGRGISYAGLVGAQLTSRMATDADLLRQKKTALPLIGRSSGLLRCWVKGAIGRRLRDLPGVKLTDDEISIFGTGINPHMGGVLFGTQGFTYVALGAASCTCTPLVFPEQLQALWERLKNLPYGDSTAMATKIMLATYLLAYAKPDPNTPAYSLAYSNGTETLKNPWVGGWRFSLFSNKCVSVSLDIPNNTTAWFTGTEVEFHESLSGDGKYRFSAALVNDLGTERFYPDGSPYLWYPEDGTPEIFRFGLNPVTPPVGPPNPILNAFYTQRDELTLVRANCAEYATTGWTIDTTTDTESCGAGKSFHSTVDSYGTKITREMRVTGGVMFTDTRRSADLTRDTYRNYEKTGLSLRMDSTASTWGGGIPTTGPGSFCAVTALGGTPDGSMYTKGWYAHWERQQGSETLSGVEINVMILGIEFTESQMWVRIARHQRDWSWSKNGYYALSGYRGFNGDGIAVFDGFLPVADSPGSGGGIPADPVTSSTSSGTEHPRRSGASVLTGDGNTEFLSFMSEGYDSGSALEAYILTPLSTPLTWGPECVQSAHMHVWANICPSYGSKVVNGPDFIANNLPIGAE